jgi:2-iminobutanoate/2-iminopropanoate deaminase
VREVIDTADAPSSPLYSQAVRAGQHLYVAGLVGIDASTGSLVGSTIQEQTRQALSNCEAVLRAAGATLEDVVEVGVLLTNPADFAGMNEEYAKWFGQSLRLAMSQGWASRSPASSSQSA